VNLSGRVIVKQSAASAAAAASAASASINLQYLHVIM